MVPLDLMGEEMATKLKGTTQAQETGAGGRLLEIVRAGEQALLAELAIVNGLNVFPVPDGDTGTNMLATVREALASAEGAISLAQATERLASGAMLGARGNSGVILSQVFRAMHDVAHGHQELTAQCVVETCRQAARLGHASVMAPVEGTMLSVLAACAETAGTEDLASQWLNLLTAAEAAVARTPGQLPILAEAQVVDSGGYGLLVWLRGCYTGLTGSPPPPLSCELLGLERVRAQADHGGVHPADLLASRPASYGYCVTLLVDAPGVDEAIVRREAAALGDSLLVVLTGSQLKLHLHLSDPEVALAYARQLGRLIRPDITNIDVQTSSGVGLPLVAVADGAGLADVFTTLGVRVVTGGPGRNPSTAQLLAACEELLASNASVLLLPNNANIGAAARQAAAARQSICVVPTSTVPQGIAAALAYDPNSDLEENLHLMARAAAAIATAEIVRAARAAELSGIAIKAGDRMVLLDGELLGVNEPGLQRLLDRIAGGSVELATIYAGVDANAQASERLKKQVLAKMPGVHVELIAGGQPATEFTLSFE